MSLLQQFWQKSESKRHSLGICIPDASRNKREARAEEVVAGGRGFNVSGIFHVHDSLMLQGTAFGSIKKKDKAKFKGKILVVEEVQVGNETTDLIDDRKKGALFLKPEKGKFPVIRIGDTLEF